MEGSLQNIRAYAVRMAAGVVVVINATGTLESFMGLRAWAQGHELVGAGGYLFPLFIDTFPLLAEVALFVGLLDGWRWKAKAVPAVVITAGVVLSVALQVGVSTSPDWATRATHGMAPVAAWLSLVIGTLMFELIVANKPKAVPDAVHVPVPEDTVPIPVPVPVPVAIPGGLDLAAAAEAFREDIDRGRVPGVNRIRKTLHVGHGAAAIVSAHFNALVTSP